MFGIDGIISAIERLTVVTIGVVVFSFILIGLLSRLLREMIREVSVMVVILVGIPQGLQVFVVFRRNLVETSRERTNFIAAIMRLGWVVTSNATSRTADCLGSEGSVLIIDLPLLASTIGALRGIEDGGILVEIKVVSERIGTIYRKVGLGSGC